ncbi:hypothetical protein TBLA_0C06750 [Henningerozyma blattae CBS 6284]|uniref:Uncharacterized protein n=1 Tax=Henningerozyma blattae (strain ATCC 34711 / CBS 6284 / DSM 70876 / NBRC 10599 / NRRL Y-10934 / UCD 77-7) TaxID=1071380 RepID=I2H265_HENB6|nr:hypothetical protein TBLA_0C06750 [Tetrapisispora blattae CBS 6284]CCH60467.1 hypothetical protein TBLA_0C06750 [Tetrapisispora blattae CBS 6284]
MLTNEISTMENEITKGLSSFTTKNFLEQGQTTDDFAILSTFRYDPNFSQLNVNEKNKIVTYNKCLFDNDMTIDLKNLRTESANWEDQDSKIDQDSELDLTDALSVRFLLLQAQIDRLNIALKYFGWRRVVTFEELFPQLVDTIFEAEFKSKDTLSYIGKLKQLLLGKIIFKMRTLIFRNGSIKIEAHPLPQTVHDTQLISVTQYFVKTILAAFIDGNEKPNWITYIDSEITYPSPFTIFKTTNRSHYTQARERLTMKIEENNSQNFKNEILLKNAYGFLSEGSITNFAIKSENNEYLTPNMNVGCLYGIMRQYLISKNLIKIFNGHTPSIKDVGGEIILTNGVMGCVRSAVCHK